MPPHSGYSYLAFGPVGDSQGKKCSRPRGEEISSVRVRSSKRGRAEPKWRCRSRPSSSTVSPYVAPLLRNAQRRRSSSKRIGIQADHLTSNTEGLKARHLAACVIGRGLTSFIASIA